MKRLKQLTALFCLMSVWFTGCGQAKVPETIEASTVIVSDKGQVTAHLVADFDKSYYDLAELTSMAEAEATEFNEAKQSEDKVVVERAELLGDARVMLTYRFDTWETYTEFNEGQLFYGTVNEAEEKGYISGIALKSVKDGSVLSEEQLKQYGDKEVIITDADADIYCPRKVAYVSEGVSVNEDGSIAAAQAEELVYILMK